MKCLFQASGSSQDIPDAGIKKEQDDSNSGEAEVESAQVDLLWFPVPMSCSISS